jgi:hypothetical protein
MYSRFSLVFVWCLKLFGMQECVMYDMRIKHILSIWFVLVSKLIPDLKPAFKLKITKTKKASTTYKCHQTRLILF